jgi:NTE family protein
MQRPDVLVLGAGGTIGAAWMAGVLAGLRETGAIDLDAVEHLVGTSAGAMLAADLLAGVEPRAPGPDHVAPSDGAAAANGAAPDAGGQWADAASAVAGGGATDAQWADAASAVPGGGATDADAGGSSGWAARALAAQAARLGGVVATPLAPLALAAARPGGARLRAAALARIAPPEAALERLRERIAGHGLRFDGRLRIACVERESGKRVVFGAPGAPLASVADAVQASCSVPWVNRPVRIGERDYVDGAIWSPTNLDAAPALRGTRVLCLSPTGGTLAAPRHAAIRAAAATTAMLETLALRRRGAAVELVAPAGGAPDEHVRLTGYRQGLALGRES